MIVEHISFDNYDQEDWELFPVSVALPSPTPKLYTVDVPGSSKQLDFSESLNGQLQYQNRTVTMVLQCFAAEDDRPNMESECKNALHGRKRKIQLDADPDYYYWGRLSVDWATEPAIDTVTITADCDPYKYKVNPTVREFDVSGSEGLDIILQNDRMPTVPTVTTDAEITVEFGESTIVFASGTRKAPDLLLLEGANHMTLTGTGHIKFEYQEGAL